MILALASTITAAFVTWQASNTSSHIKMITSTLDEQITQLENKPQGAPEQEQIIFATLNRSGLSHLIPGLVNTSGDHLLFWKTGLYLIDSYLTDKSNGSKYAKALSDLANVKDIAPSSKGFLLYLTGKLEKNEGHSESAIKYFDLCKKETPLMYEYLMSQDPAYDLNSIRIWLTTHKGLDKLSRQNNP